MTSKAKTRPGTRSEGQNEPEEFPKAKKQGKTTQHRLNLGGGKSLQYKAVADWQKVYRGDQAVAEVFHVAYLARPKRDERRPITFVFNGGPGAASAFLHMGALGPKRIQFDSVGNAPKPPTEIVDNPESWLPFTDLVFVDPVGTGFSHALLKKPTKEDEDREKKLDEVSEEFWDVEGDLNSLGEFFSSFLSNHSRWLSPIFIAGESYGGFRVAKLTRTLQEKFGIGLSGAVLISPAIEFASIISSDYDIASWVETFPSIAATAHHHGKVDQSLKKLAQKDFIEKAENFAQNELTLYLSQGRLMPEAKRKAVTKRYAQFSGMDPEFVARNECRISIFKFTRELLKDENRVCGWYDGSIVGIDPFPDRSNFEGPDPTLYGIDRLFRSGINAQLRDVLGVETDRDYELLSMKAFQAWKNQNKEHKLFGGTPGAMDDLRFGMTINPHMKVWISHGMFDLITPYFSSDRLVSHMKLDGELESNITLHHYHGGHMFYTWDKSRKSFTRNMKDFYATSVSGERRKKQRSKMPTLRVSMMDH